MSDEQLEKGRYVKDGNLIRKWKLPYFKGQGVLIKKVYELKLTGENNNSF